MFFKNREIFFYLVVVYLILLKVFLVFFSFLFIIKSFFTREYFFGFFRIRKMMFLIEIFFGRLIFIVFFVCKIRRYMYLNFKEVGWSINLKLVDLF